MLLSKNDMTKVCSLLVESLCDLSDDNLLDLSLTAEQSFKLDDGPDGEERYVQVIFLPGSKEIFDRMPDPRGE